MIDYAGSKVKVNRLVDEQLVEIGILLQRAQKTHDDLQAFHDDTGQDIIVIETEIRVFDETEVNIGGTSSSYLSRVTLKLTTTMAQVI
jgi:hypothetical protein